MGKKSYARPRRQYSYLWSKIFVSNQLQKALYCFRDYGLNEGRRSQLFLSSSSQVW
jgi:hypothetical protein